MAQAEVASQLAGQATHSKKERKEEEEVENWSIRDEFDGLIG